MMRPSSKTSSLSPEPFRPPMSTWCTLLIEKPISRSPVKAGVVTKTSAVWPLQSQGSLQMKTSPGRTVSGGNAARRFFPNTGMTPVCPVAPSHVWATRLPRSS